MPAFQAFLLLFTTAVGLTLVSLGLVIVLIMIFRSQSARHPGHAAVELVISVWLISIGLALLLFGQWTGWPALMVGGLLIQVATVSISDEDIDRTYKMIRVVLVGGMFVTLFIGILHMVNLALPGGIDALILGDHQTDPQALAPGTAPGQDAEPAQ